MKSGARGKLKVVELFAGVGGFRLGLEGKTRNQQLKSRFETVWANQWEPGVKIQHAANVYRNRFKTGHDEFFNKDIEEVVSQHIEVIPDHDLLCGGFPCQDYSVARTLRDAAGLVGKKGVLWWDIHGLIERKKRKPKYLFLENVDRLLKSPASQRGRDFAIMLASLANLGYAVEWRVVNAADYGLPQRRRRVFILGYHKSTTQYKRLKKAKPRDWIEREGVFARALPVISNKIDYELAPSFTLPDGELSVNLQNLIKITEVFNRGNAYESPFENAGLMIAYDVWTEKVTPRFRGKKKVLADILVDDSQVPESYYLDESDLQKWKFLKGPKSIERVSKSTGARYSYDEGGMVFPDALDKPSRTIITGEGGKTPSRFKHVVRAVDGRLRRLIPVELERLNGFPDNHTKLEGVPDNRRAFFMGNALIVGVVDKVARQLEKDLDD